MIPLPIPREKNMKSLGNRVSKTPQPSKVVLTSGIKKRSASCLHEKQLASVAKKLYTEESVTKKKKSEDTLAVKISKTVSETKVTKSKLVESDDTTTNNIIINDSDYLINRHKKITATYFAMKSQGVDAQQNDFRNKNETSEHTTKKRNACTTYVKQLPKRQNAAMKIYSILLYNVCQKKNREVEQCNKQLVAVETPYAKSKKQKLVVSTMLRIEQKRNHKIRQQLKQCNDLVRITNESCKSLQNSINLINDVKKSLKLELESKIKLCEDLQIAIEETKIKIDENVSKQNDLLIELNVHKLQNEKLGKQIDCLEETMQKLKKKIKIDSKELIMQLVMKRQQCLRMLTEVECLQNVFDELKLKENEIQAFQEKEFWLKRECEDLHLIIINLENCLKHTFIQSFKHFCCDFKTQITVIHILGCIVFCMMPVAPLPFITFIERTKNFRWNTVGTLTNFRSYFLQRFFK